MKVKRIAAISLTTVTLGVLLAITTLVLLGCGSTETATIAETAETTSGIPANLPEPSTFTITVYQPQECTCCSEYVTYLRNEGFQVEVVYLKDGGAAIREKYPVPPNLVSCHISVVEDYFVEGHVPSEVILTLLAQKPAIDGIVLPGMPSGSPGMGGPKIGALKIYAISDGKVSEFLTLF